MNGLFHSMSSRFRAMEYAFSRLARRRGVSVCVILLLALGARLAVLRVEPIPAPGVHDEFSYLLMADTFAHGRLTNPTHPMWVHFESEAINQQPTYCSMYYPAQGAFMALGQVVFGHPFWGVWLSTGLMCAAICWALQGWMPPAWALLGGILVIVRLGVFNYWANSYWGGSVAALGGALVLGALPRIKRQQRIRDAVLMGIGFALLANSRPYEGLIYSLPILVALAFFVFGKKAPPLGLSLSRIVLPFGIVMAFTLLFMGYYFWRTTGNPIRPPYMVNVAAYMQEPQFIWQKMGPPVQFRHASMEQFYRRYHMRVYFEYLHNPVGVVLRRIFEFWIFFIGPILTIPFFLLCFILPYGVSFRDLGPKTSFLLVTLLVVFIALLFPVPFFAHYAAPATGVVIAVLLQAFRRVRIWGRASSKGLWATRAVLVLFLAGFALPLAALLFGVPRDKVLALGMSSDRVLRFDLSLSNWQRSQMISSLRKMPGQYLIIVRTRPDRESEEEWVYNDADIDNSKIVWAREMTPEGDKELLEYFKNRQVLLLNADANPPTVQRHSMSDRED